MIDWDLIRKNWNRDHKTKFLCRKELIENLYAKYKTCTKVGDLLLVSKTTIHFAMKKDNLKLLCKGRRLPTEKQNLILKLNTSQMTVKEIAKKAGITSDYTGILLKRFKKEYKGKII